MPVNVKSLCFPVVSCSLASSSAGLGIGLTCGPCIMIDKRNRGRGFRFGVSGCTVTAVIIMVTQSLRQTTELASLRSIRYVLAGWLHCEERSVTDVQANAKFTRVAGTLLIVVDSWKEGSGWKASQTTMGPPETQTTPQQCCHKRPWPNCWSH